MSNTFLKSLATLALGAAVLAQPALAQNKPLKIGVTAGPHAQIFEVVKEEAAKQGLQLQVIEFTDYVQPNVALATGDLDANSYQHQPYLDNANADRKYGLASVAKTVIFPIGIYSKKIKSLDQLPNGARIGIPNDPTNGGRALLLLQSKGLIKLRPEAGLKATPSTSLKTPRSCVSSNWTRPAAALARRHRRLRREYQLRAGSRTGPRQGRHRPGSPRFSVCQRAGRAWRGTRIAPRSKSWLVSTKATPPSSSS
ncbi:D-methionine ABC transporter substrate-binding protein [Bordetella holmesii]|nr:D-methionine ABC transporter substrate-binding protein [Bordetella holmesii]